MCIHPIAIPFYPVLSVPLLHIVLRTGVSISDRFKGRWVDEWDARGGEIDR